MSSGSWNIWIDTGGTFTDCLAVSPDGTVIRQKVLSSGKLKGKVDSLNDNEVILKLSISPRKDIFKGYQIRFGQQERQYRVKSYDPDTGKAMLEEPLPEGFSAGEFEITAGEEAPILVSRIITETPLKEELPYIHMRLGFTKGTNALLERSGDAPVLLVTKGFKDLLEIGNQQRNDLFALKIQKTKQLYDFVVEIDERLDAQGNVLKQLSDDTLNKLHDLLPEDKEQPIAIGLMHSYKNDEHEKKLKHFLEGWGYVNICLSSEASNLIKLLPRTQTAVANAYLLIILTDYLDSISNQLSGGKLEIMTSTGGLLERKAFLPKDSLLSGPAGGLIGASRVAKNLNIDKIITLDMGGTSTDVARYDGSFDYRYETHVGDARLLTPSLAIETIAAGGGSICSYDGYKLQVGPESGSADPGPACYGAGGPLCMTDINLLTGRLSDLRFGIPIHKDKAEEALSSLLDQMGDNGQKEKVLLGILEIANEKMAEAINKISVQKGYDPIDYALLGFGGAGGMHICGVAEKLGMKRFVIPYDAGILSAYGIGRADLEKAAIKQLMLPAVQKELEGRINEEYQELKTALLEENHKEHLIFLKEAKVSMRFEGQDETIDIIWESDKDLLKVFEKAYRQQYQHWISDRKVEAVSMRVVAAVSSEEQIKLSPDPGKENEDAQIANQNCLLEEGWVEIPVYDHNLLTPGKAVKGPCIVVNKTSTTFIAEGWKGTVSEEMHLTGKYEGSDKDSSMDDTPEQVKLELYTNRFTAIADQMGSLLARSSFSVNIKERLDFSCALLDNKGDLIVNAPHIPVHLGALGICVKEVDKHLDLKEGDMAITNHPGYGGSHLPDITLIAPVYSNDQLIGFVSNRAHHAEVGGKSPGSMPVDAQNLAEEGVTIPPTKITKDGEVDWDILRSLFTSGPYPSRAIRENEADLNASIASLIKGKKELINLCQTFGNDEVLYFMSKLKGYASDLLKKKLKTYAGRQLSAIEKLDAGAQIKVTVDASEDHLTIDFTGTSPVLNNNLNANKAITTSATLYVLRLLIGEEIPMNEGILNNVKIILPDNSLINPDFSENPEECPAVVGGNVETSQRIVDTLLKAFELAAGSQGTMNNTLFGNDSFGFYETICGGEGASEDHHGSSAVHTHMTNTRITDPEVLEFRYPVRLDQFAIREESGGKGRWNGGNGVIRQLTFLEDVTATVLAEHRKEQPFGLNGGDPGATGRQFVFRENKWEQIGNKTTLLKAGEKLKVETPGGGGFGKE